jgi:serine O-acetyltransferase
MENIKADLDRYFKNNSRSVNPSVKKKIRIILEHYYGVHAIFVYRFGYWIESETIDKKTYLLKQLLLGAYYILNFLVIKMYDIRISRKAKIGKGLYITHFGGIIISNCILGEHCTVNQRAQIEGDDFSSNEELSHIGDNVWIGPHAIIKKGIKIGDGATIAAGSVVLADVEKQCLTLGNPARILNKNFDNSILNV